MVQIVPYVHAHAYTHAYAPAIQAPSQCCCASFEDARQQPGKLAAPHSSYAKAMPHSPYAKVTICMPCLLVNAELAKHGESTVVNPYIARPCCDGSRYPLIPTTTKKRSYVLYTAPNDVILEAFIALLSELYYQPKV